VFLSTPLLVSRKTARPLPPPQGQRPGFFLPVVPGWERPGSG